MDETNNVLTIRISDTASPQFGDGAKDILTDATISFTREGIKIINFDKTHTIIVNVVLSASKFELFNCVPRRLLFARTPCIYSRLFPRCPTTTRFPVYRQSRLRRDSLAPGSSIRQRRHQAVLQPKLRLIEPDPEELVVPTWNTRRS
jgi:hypothetical protein